MLTWFFDSLRAVPVTTVVLTGLLHGCLGSSYTVDREELVRLAQAGPAGGNRAVRATQRFSFDEGPEATAAAPVDADARLHFGISPVPLEWQIVHAARSRRGRAPQGHDRPAVAVGSPSPRPTVEVRGSGAVGGSGSSSTSSTSTSDGASSADDGGDVSGTVIAAVVVIAGSAFVAATLAATEGMRYDGWLELGADHPVTLLGPDGQAVWVPLGKLDPGLAAWADEAVIDTTDGPVGYLARAPLDRVGFAFELDLGAGSFASSESVAGPVGFESRLAFGGFPVQSLGFFLGLGVGFLPNATEWRPHAEVQLLPLGVDRFHLGAYGQAGYLAGFIDVTDAPTARPHGFYAGGGLMMQIDIATRLALDVRLGLMAHPRAGATDVLPEASIGVAIY